MSKSYVLFSLALGGLVVAGCNKEETPAPAPASPATAPSASPATEPASAPTTGPTTSAALDSANAVVAGAERKAEDGVAAALKSAPTTSPITDANK